MLKFKDFSNGDYIEYQSMMRFPSGEQPKIAESKYGAVNTDIIIGKDNLEEKRLVCACMVYDHDELYADYEIYFKIDSADEEETQERKAMDYFLNFLETFPNIFYDDTSYLIKVCDYAEQQGMKFICSNFPESFLKE